MVDEGDALGDGEAVVALGHTRPHPTRHAHHHTPPGGRDPPNELRVELEECRHCRVSKARDDIETGGVGDGDLVELKR